MIQGGLSAGFQRLWRQGSLAAARQAATMFWRVTNFTTTAVEAILDKPNFTLEDLLEEDELIQVRFFSADIPWSRSALLLFLHCPRPRSCLVSLAMCPSCHALGCLQPKWGRPILV